MGNTDLVIDYLENKQHIETDMNECLKDYQAEKSKQIRETKKTRRVRHCQLQEG